MSAAGLIFDKLASDRSMDPLNDRLLDPPHRRWGCDEPASLTPGSVLTDTKECSGSSSRPSEQHDPVRTKLALDLILLCFGKRKKAAGQSLSVSFSALFCVMKKFLSDPGNEKREPEKSGSLWGNLIWSG